MYAAVDDTDSVSHMCTTFLATELVRELDDYDVIGLPRLVRLNPAVPWKTRGNGALCLRFGKGSGTRRLIGRIGSRPIYSFSRLRSEIEEEDVLERASRLVIKWSRVSEEASPGLVVSTRAPSPGLYWQAVRGIVARGDVETELDRIGALRFELEGGRGVIGAAAAMSWRPKDRTFEVLAYRSRSRWGAPRIVDATDVMKLDERFPSTFNNYDEATCKPAITPHSGCPILMGVRGDDPDELVEAVGSVRSEEKERWLLFLTNQGTDDHIIRRWTELLPNRSYAVRGVVSARPTTVEGGHVILRIDAASHGPLDCAAYEPSHSFRNVIKRLRAGDEVTVLGELRDQPRTLNIEKLRVVRLSEVQRKVRNPVCPVCHKSMKSIGRGSGFRCKRCRRKAEGGSAQFEVERRELVPGWYEPPVCSRRHLSMPLKRQFSRTIRSESKSIIDS